MQLNDKAHGGDIWYCSCGQRSGIRSVRIWVWAEGAWYELGFLFLSPLFPFSSWRCHLDSSMGQKRSRRLGNYHHRFTRWFGQSLEMVWISSSFSALMFFFCIFLSVVSLHPSCFTFFHSSFQPLYNPFSILCFAIFPPTYSDVILKDLICLLFLCWTPVQLLFQFHLKKTLSNGLGLQN